VHILHAVVRYFVHLLIQLCFILLYSDHLVVLYHVVSDHLVVQYFFAVVQLSIKIVFTFLLICCSFTGTNNIWYLFSLIKLLSITNNTGNATWSKVLIILYIFNSYVILEFTQNYAHFDDVGISLLIEVCHNVFYTEFCTFWWSEDIIAYWSKNWSEFKHQTVETWERHLYRKIYIFLIIFFFYLTIFTAFIS